MIDLLRATTLSGLVLFLTGCATPERVVLLPQADGRPSTLVIKGPSGDTLLAEPYAEALVSTRETRTLKTDAASVAARYGDLLSALPSRPETVVLNFESGSNELTPDSSTRLSAIQALSTRFPAAEIIVTGHTDRVGSLEANDALSFKRAQTVAARLTAAGIAPERIISVGRGERESLIPTDDEVAEPRNRRVEVRVR